MGEGTGGGFWLVSCGKKLVLYDLYLPNEDLGFLSCLS